jgi:hypothetical protein
VWRQLFLVCNKWSITLKFAAEVALATSDSRNGKKTQRHRTERRRKLGQWAQQTYQIGQRRAARMLNIGWSTWMYRKKVRRWDAVLRRRLCEMAASHLRYGYALRFLSRALPDFVTEAESAAIEPAHSYGTSASRSRFRICPTGLVSFVNQFRKMR